MRNEKKSVKIFTYQDLVKILLVVVFVFSTTRNVSDTRLVYLFFNKLYSIIYICSFIEYQHS